MDQGSPSANHSRSAQASSAERNTNNNNTAGVGIDNQHQTPTMVEEVRMPINHLTRIMQSALPPDAKVSDDAKELLQFYLSKFVSRITSEAIQQGKVEHQEVVSAEDLLWTINRLGFEEYVRPLGKDLKNYRNHEAQLNMDGSGASGSNNGNDDGQR